MYVKSKPRSSSYHVHFAVISLLFYVTEASFARKVWEKEFLTNDSADSIYSIRLDEASGNAFVAGKVIGPRGMNVSLKGIAYNQDESIENAAIESDTEVYNHSRLFEDAVILKFASNTGNVRWIHRLTGLYENSKYLSIDVSSDGSEIYAAGSAKNPSSGVENAMLTILDASTGDVRTTLIYPSSSISYITALVAEETGLFMCGTNNSVPDGQNMPTNDTNLFCGVFVMSTNLSGAPRWSRRGGLSFGNGYCSGISHSAGQNAIYVSSNVYPQGANKENGTIYASRLSASTGEPQWTTMVERQEFDDDSSAGILADEYAVFIGVNRRKGHGGNFMYLYKFGCQSGTLLWGRETCCSGLSSLRTSAENNGQGQAVSAKGLIKFYDGYMYQLGHIKNTEENSVQRYSSIITRTSLFGHSIFSRDKALIKEYFQYELHAPREVIGDSSGRIFAIANSGDPEGSDEEANNVKFAIYGIDLKAGDGDNGNYLPSNGKYYAKLQAILSNAFADVQTLVLTELLAEQLRIPAEQVVLLQERNSSSARLQVLDRKSISASNYSSNNTENNSESEDGEKLYAVVTLYFQNEDDPLVNVTVSRLSKTLVDVGSDGLSPLERLAGVQHNASNTSSQARVVATGLTSELRNSRNWSTDSADIESKTQFSKFTLGLSSSSVGFAIIFVAACCILALAGIAVFQYRKSRRHKLSKSDSEYWTLQDSPWTEYEDRRGRKVIPV